MSVKIAQFTIISMTSFKLSVLVQLSSVCEHQEIIVPNPSHSWLFLKASAIPEIANVRISKSDRKRHQNANNNNNNYFRHDCLYI